MMALRQFIQECHNDLKNNTTFEVEQARTYLKKDRKLFERSWETHKLGYCKSDFKIPDCIRYFGANDKEPEFTWDMSNRIQGRIIVPIYSEFGKVIAFATRVPTTEPDNPWWNLPRPFSKGNHLFLLDKTRKKVFEKNKIYIVEGYIDALIPFEKGLKNIAAVMGTAYSHRKIGLTARYCNNVCFCFDSDANKAGTKAKFISIAILAKYSFCESISVIDELPVGKDPASFIGEYGLDSFLEMERILDDAEITKICHDVSKSKRGELLDAQ